MAPITRGGRNRSLAPFAEEIWEFPSSHDSREDPNGNAQSESEEDENVEDVTEDPSATQQMTMDDVEEALYPLKRAVDRVGTQLEDFAQRLDQFKPHSAGDTSPYQKACDLIKEYQEIAQRTVESLRKSSANGATSSDEEDEEKELESWENEARTWDLFASVLITQDPKAHHEARMLFHDEGEWPHRYSTDDDLWENALRTDPLLFECVAILTWLQRTADEARGSIADCVAKRLRINDGSPSQGWLYTKESIKSQKRLRSWPRPLDPEDPGIEVSLTRNSDNSPLVTQLDPDAPNRQGRHLQVQDQAFEQETWLTCWEMIRRGRSWAEIQEWCVDRSDFWKACSLKGPASEEDDPFGLSRFKNSCYNRLWQEMCAAAAQDRSMGPFERAVYSLFGGETPPDLSSMNLFPSWSDLLFQRFNDTVVGLYDGYLQRHFRRSHSMQETDHKETPRPPNDWACSLVEQLKNRQESKDEATTPFHLIQGAIIGKTYDTFFQSQGKAFSVLANQPDPSVLYPRDLQKNFDEGALAICDDHNLIRIVSHMLLLLKEAGIIDVNKNLAAYENNVVAYIEFLEQAGRMALVPLYASRLSNARSIQTLSRVLITVTDRDERQELVTLMEKYSINTARVLHELAMNVYLEMDTNVAERYPRHTVLLPRQGRHMVSDIKHGFMGTGLNNADERLVRALTWHECLEGHWNQTCVLAQEFYERCFAIGHLNTAREISQRFSLENVSIRVTGIDLSHPVLSPENILEPKETSTDPTTLHEQASFWRELEQLSLALDALETWRDMVATMENDLSLRSSRPFKKALRTCLEEVTIAMVPVISNPDFLLRAPASKQAVSYHQIRLAYIPEIILAYNTVLVVAGYYVSRENLLECLNLATSVAESEELTKLFVECGRVRELTDAMAVASRTLLSANERGNKKIDAGKGRLKARTGKGETSAIWDVDVDIDVDAGPDPDGRQDGEDFTSVSV